MSIRNICSLLTLGVALIASAAQAETDAYFADRIWLGSGNAIQDGVLLVRDGLVLRVGSRNQIAIPPDARRHELGGRVIIPGLVVAHTSLGVADDDENAITPQVRAIDGFDLFEDYSPLLAGGVTTVQISPGRQRLVPGQGAVVKLAGDDPQRRVLAVDESLRLDLSEASRNPPRVFEPPVGAVSEDRPFEPTRPQLSATLAGAAAGLRALLQAAKSATDAERADDPRLAAIAPYVANRRSLRVTAESAAEIQAALSIASEFSLPLVLVDPKNLEPFVDRLPTMNSRLVGVILNANVRPGRIGSPPVPDPEGVTPRAVWEYAAELGEKGLGDMLCIRPENDDDLAELLFLGGLFTRSGASSAQALKMLTSNPAQLLGVANRVGSLAAGRDADFVVLSDDPFQSQTRVLATYVDGQSVFDVDASNSAMVIQASMIHVGSGRMYRNGSVVISDGKIRDVGVNVSTPPTAAIKHYPGAVITPGLIDLSTGLGLGGPVSGTINLQTKLGEELTGDDPAIAVAREGGVTTAVLAGSGSPTPMTAFKLGDQPVVLADPVGVRFTVGANLTDAVGGLKRTLQAGKSYADSWTKYDEDMKEYRQKLKQYEADLAKYEAEQAAKEKAEAKEDSDEDKDKEQAKEGADAKKPEGEAAKTDSPADEAKKTADESSDSPKKGDSPPTPAGDKSKTEASAENKDSKGPAKPNEPKKPSENAALEPYRALMGNRIPAFVQIENVKAAEAAVELFRDEFNLRTVLIADDDLDRVATLLAEKKVQAAIGPTLVRRRDGQIVNLPQALDNHQVDFGFLSQARTGVRDLPLVVQYAVRQGLGPDAALQALTAKPARILALPTRIGTLAVGHDADLVVWSGPPFEISSEVLAVMIDGRWVYQKGTQE